MITRCHWANASTLETDYHDHEWGVPVHDDRLLFEALTLESAQAGLSWSTILKKRDGYRQAFNHFNVEKVAQYTSEDIERLLQNPAIIRNKLKVNATITNAQRIIAIQASFGSFDQFIWSFVNHKPIRNQWHHQADLPATSSVSDAMSSSLKKHGFKFIGSTTCYAFMQATGMVNDHVVTCFRHNQC